MGLANYSFAVEREVRSDDAALGFLASDMEEHQQKLKTTGKLELGRLLSLGFEHQMVDQRDFADEYIGSFLLSRNAAEWEENVINATTLNIGLLDERLRLMTNFDLSRYSASETDADVVMGHRINQNMELDVLRGDDLSLSVFGAYGEADQNYHDFGLEDKKGSVLRSWQGSDKVRRDDRLWAREPHS